MPFQMHGLASDIDTKAIIDKLVEVEARPITNWQRQIDKNKVEIKAWDNISTALKALSTSVKNLYTFRAHFEDKKVTVADDSFTASANRLAPDMRAEIQVVQLAQPHRIISDSISNNKKLSAGRFTIESGGKSAEIDFAGGTLEELAELIQKQAQGIVSITFAHDTAKSGLLMIESVKPGKNSEIKLSPITGLLSDIGFSTILLNTIADKKLIFKKSMIEKISGRGEISIAKTSLILDGENIVEYRPTESIDSKNTLVISYSYYPFDYAELSRIAIGDKSKIEVGDVVIHDENILRDIDSIIEKPKNLIPAISLTIVYGNSQKDIKLDIDKGKESIDLSFLGNERVYKLIFNNNIGKIVINNIKIKIQSDERNFKFKNELLKPQNAVFLLNGMRLERENNKGIDDVVKGVTFNLNRVSDKPVEMQVEKDIEAVEKDIEDFVQAYNDVILILTEYSKAAKVKQLNNYQKLQDEQGVLSADTTLYTLHNRLRTIMMNAYDTGFTNYRMLYQIGIEDTSKPGDEHNAPIPSNGTIQLNKDKLTDILNINTVIVQNLFAYDTNSDNVYDTGVGYVLDRNLKPYIQFGNNIIKTKQKTLREQIAELKKKIDKWEQHLLTYGQSLSGKFGSMEQALSELKAKQKWLEQQTKGR